MGTELHGVGNKVEDCIALFSLDKADCIPVDTHVFQISKKFKFVSQVSALNPKTYLAINEAWVKRYGERAGWAHQILFAADLNSFQHKLDSKKRTAEEASLDRDS